MTAITQIERRRIEAEILAETYDAMCGSMPAEKACAIIAEATANAARKAGRAFAATAPDGPNLQHFSEVVAIWRAGDALDIEDVELSADRFSLRVTRCEYARLYIEEMGLPKDLAYAISCVRDGSFAEGYSPCLSLRRSQTIAQGSEGCLFEYAWDCGAA